MSIDTKKRAGSPADVGEQSKRPKVDTTDLTVAAVKSSPSKTNKKRRRARRTRGHKDGFVKPGSVVASKEETTVPAAPSITKIEDVWGAFGNKKADSESSSSRASSPKLAQPNEALATIPLTSKNASDNVIDEITTRLTCEICSEIFTNPYATVPCGHVACYECLVTWFKTQRPLPFDVDQDFTEAAPLLSRQKSCPVCRTTLTRRPVMVFIVKSLCEIIAPKAVKDAPKQLPGSLPYRRDPWQGVFPVDKYDVTAATGLTMDHEDGVMRCRDCMHEVWDGLCAGCGRVFDVADVQGALSGGSDLSDSERSEGAEDSYEGSFIDDGDILEHDVEGEDLGQESEVEVLDERDDAEMLDITTGGSGDKAPLIADRSPQEATEMRAPSARRAVVVSDDDE